MVVQVAGDAGALVLLRGDDALQQHGDVMVRVGARLHLRLELAGPLPHALSKSAWPRRSASAACCCVDRSRAIFANPRLSPSRSAVPLQ